MNKAELFARLASTVDDPRTPVMILPHRDHVPPLSIVDVVSEHHNADGSTTIWLKVEEI